MIQQGEESKKWFVAIRNGAHTLGRHRLAPGRDGLLAGDVVRGPAPVAAAAAGVAAAQRLPAPLLAHLGGVWEGGRGERGQATTHGTSGQQNLPPPPRKAIVV